MYRPTYIYTTTQNFGVGKIILLFYYNKKLFEKKKKKKQ